MSGILADTSQNAEAAILDLYRKFLDGGRTVPTLLPLNEGAIARFEALKFPRPKHEMYTFVNTKELVSTPFHLLQQENPVEADWVRRHIYPGCEKSRLCLVDGVLRPEHSNTSALGSSLKVVPLEEAVADPQIKNHLQETVQNENDVFASINSAFLKHGVMLEVEPKAQLETPLEILHISTGSNSGPVTTHPRLLLKLGQMSELRVIVKFVGAGANYFVNAVQDVILEEDAGLTFSQVQADVPDSWHFSKNRIKLNRNSWFIASNGSCGNRLTRHHYEAHLHEVGAELRLNGVSVLVKDQQVHNFIRIHHEAPHGASHQHFKNVINDRGRASFDGTVIVNKGAQLTHSDQLINNLMLSEEGHADSKPNLMIFADDVKCTHGATVGQIDEEQLFYLKTRGMSEGAAKELLTKSFAKSIIDTVRFPAVVDDLHDLLLKKLEANHA